MTLSQLKAFLIERKRVSLDEISIHFDTQASAVQPMVQHWITKGKARTLEEDATACGKAVASCCCPKKTSPLFEWIG